MSIFCGFLEFILLSVFCVKTVMPASQNVIETIPILQEEWHKNLNSYKDILEYQLSFVNRELKNIERFNGTDGVATQLDDPISIFALLASLTEHRKKIQDALILSNGIFRQFLNTTSEFTWPSHVDLQKTALAVARVQDTYNLNASNLAKGKITDSRNSLEMSVTDCLVLGQQLYESGSLSFAEIWLREAESKFENDTNEKDISVHRNILESLATLYERKENFDSSLEIVKTLSEMFSDDESYVEITQHLMEKIEWQRQNPVIAEDLTDLDKEIRTQEMTVDFLYKALCRNEVERMPDVLAPLRCRYVTNNSPFLKIAPLKSEELSLDPYIVIFYDVLYDREIEVIKNMAFSELKPSKTGTELTGINIDERRTSKSGYIKESRHELFKTLSVRVEDITGLSDDYSEELQVVKYNIGEHYIPHHDFEMKVLPNQTFEDQNGNRIATVLFYMNDVEAGGATVFPIINLSVPARKGSALFWYNLYKSGRGHYLTSHAGCPVLLGQKWVANKWLHEFGQEFKRPCDLDLDDPEKFRHYDFL